MLVKMRALTRHGTPGLFVMCFDLDWRARNPSPTTTLSAIPRNDELFREIRTLVLSRFRSPRDHIITPPQPTTTLVRQNYNFFLSEINCCIPVVKRINMSPIMTVQFSVEPISHGPTDRLRRTHDRRPSDPDVQQSSASRPGWPGYTER